VNAKILWPRRPDWTPIIKKLYPVEGKQDPGSAFLVPVLMGRLRSEDAKPFKVH
jgi:hypothetical protein